MQDKQKSKLCHKYSKNSYNAGYDKYMIKTFNTVEPDYLKCHRTMLLPSDFHFKMPPNKL